MQIYIYRAILAELTTGLVAFITAQGFTIIIMKIVITSAVLNIILDPVFIFGFGMEMRRTTLATIISQAISTVLVFAFLCGKKTILKVRKKYIRLDIKLLLPCLTLELSPRSALTLKKIS